MVTSSSSSSSLKQPAYKNEEDNNDTIKFSVNTNMNEDSELSYVDANGWRVMNWNAVSIPPPDNTTETPPSPSSSSSSSQSTNKRLALPTEIARYDQLTPNYISPHHSSPVEVVCVRNRRVYIKRDDLLKLDKSSVSGNKARKLLSMSMLSIDEFPDVVVSYGGPQSNAMLALAAIVSQKDDECKGRDDSVPSSERGREEDPPPRLKRFVYYTKKLPRWLRKQPSGNLLRAISLGMELRELEYDEYRTLFGGEHGGSCRAPSRLDPPVRGNSVWVPQGGACGVACLGASKLAHEIAEFWTKQGQGMPLAVALPGGTGSTALLLQREINAIQKKRRDANDNTNDKLDISVVVVPCVGDYAYLTRQMKALDKSTGGPGTNENLPDILQPIPDKKYGSHRKKSGGYFVFGEPAAAILNTFYEMKEEHGVFLDLLYGSPAWSLLLQQWKITQSSSIWGKRNIDPNCPIAGKQIMYVHCGGLEGISSQMTRYKHKGLIDPKELQG
eukprot:CAMPEP_0195509150 /NCGR_PEP_ID=MMETSP0794_2-20130614/2171_1 /TAXON_ID=515487 /ORGANISM="Stephanopyxis turris, Strain CCMP 815" /LENGTH=499 /DNA_ID=CAMNT_0040636305 /DNA_START=496 /DNA_END=1995 /DNA_ORIENTATION=+